MALDRYVSRTMERERLEPSGRWETWKGEKRVFVWRDPRGRFARGGYEYTKWFYYPKSAINRKLDLEARLFSRKPLSLAEAERKIDEAMRNDYNMGKVTWTSTKMGGERLVTRLKGVWKSGEVKVFDKARKQTMTPWHKYHRKKS